MTAHPDISLFDGRVVILVGDVLERLREIPDESIDCVVTSPPYWGLRDYGVDGQIGLEPTLGEHLDMMVEVFAEIWRVLKPTGTVWLNYGDCYASAPNGRSAADTKAAGNDDRTFRDKPFSTVGPIYDPNGGRKGGGYRGDEKRPSDAAPGGRVVGGGMIKEKDLVMIPNRLAIRLQEWGWWVRSEIIWAKPNPMPDSNGAYRPATAHEKIFLLTKSANADVWRARDTGEVSFFPDLSERCPLVTRPDKMGARWQRMGAYYDSAAVRIGGPGYCEPNAPDKISSPMGQGFTRRASEAKRPAKKQRGHVRPHVGFNERWDKMSAKEQAANGRNLRNYEPAPPVVWPIPTKPFSDAHFATFPPELAERCILAGCPVGGQVLDPFGGAGTTGLVAEAFGRHATLIELNPEYAEIARTRIERLWMGRDEAKRARVKKLADVSDLPMFSELKGQGA